MIEVTGVNLAEFAKAVYELSKPQGLGFLQFQEGGLSTAEAEAIVRGDDKHSWQKSSSSALDMDYVKGRACKMHVHKSDDGKLTIQDSWYDHTDAQFDALLARFNLKREAKPEHSSSCNCDACRRK